MNKSSTEGVNLIQDNQPITVRQRRPRMDCKVRIEITKEDNLGIVSFKDSCISDVEGIAAASRQIKKFIEENRPAKIIFDFTGVKFFSSQVLGLLLDIRAALQPYNGQVVVSAINPQLHRVFKITNLDKIFRFYPNRDSAVKTVNAG